MLAELQFIKGGVAKDQRGQIRFVNDFDMSLVKRFYIIKNADTALVRGWRGHQIEQRWFYVLSGAFEIELVKIDNWVSPSLDLPIENLEMNVYDQKVLHVPPGYGTSFRALEQGSEMLVFADYLLSHALEDDHTWPSGYFVNS